MYRRTVFTEWAFFYLLGLSLVIEKKVKSKLKNVLEEFLAKLIIFFLFRHVLNADVFFLNRPVSFLYQTV